MADPPRVYENVIFRFVEPGELQPKVSKPGRIRVTPGNIELVMAEETIHIKPSDLSQTPKIAPTGKRFALDFIKSTESKYQFIILDLGVSGTKEDLTQLHDVVMYAWTPIGGDLNTNEMALPSSRQNPNWASNATKNQTGESSSSSSSSIERPERSVKERETAKRDIRTCTSYAEQAKKAQADKGEYKCVDKKKNEVEPISFYGAPNSLTHFYGMRKNPIGLGGLSTKDSIDAAARASRYRSSISHNGISTMNMRAFLDDDDEFDDSSDHDVGFRKDRENEPMATAKRPSLTSQASIAAFDRVMGRSSNLPYLVSRNQRPALIGTKSQSGDFPSSSSSSIERPKRSVKELMKILHEKYGGDEIVYPVENDLKRKLEKEEEDKGDEERSQGKERKISNGSAGPSTVQTREESMKESSLDDSKRQTEEAFKVMADQVNILPERDRTQFVSFLQSMIRETVMEKMREND